MQWARLTATLLVAAWLAYLVVFYGLSAAALGRGDAGAALALRPNSVQALSLASEQALARNDVAGAENLAHAALARVPRDVRALRVMGFATSLRGRRRLGSELLLRAGILSWRDDVTQAWLIRVAIDQGNFATAAQRLDAMLRSGQHQADMLRIAHGMAADPEARTALIDRLVEAPPWREQFFAGVEAMPKGTEQSHVLLIEELRGREGPLPRGELAGFIRHLVDQGDVALARRVWLGTLSAEDRTMVAGVFDGDFRQDAAAESAQPRYLFEWALEEGGGAMASIGTPPLLIGETALNARSGDTEQRLASQTIVLAPGAHRLTYATAPVTDTSPQYFTWRILCVGHNGKIPLGPPVTRTVGNWRAAVQNFEVPQGCGAQRIELVALAGASGAEIWFDHVSVQ